MKILPGITSPDDLQGLSHEELLQLCDEIRAFLIHAVSKTGGHLASNLGVVELTIALHRVFHTPEDKIVWDVGHQSYVHKILTGRMGEFGNLRSFEGMAGFPKRSESIHDCFNTGHSSTSVSAALGLARARDMKGQDHQVIAVIGDGALTGGMAFEALNDLGHSGTPMLVILNDNEMSIARNVGGLSKYLAGLRTAPSYFKVKRDVKKFLHKMPAGSRELERFLDNLKRTIKYQMVPGILFEELGLTYIGPVDGHDLGELQAVLTRISKMREPVFLHVITQKGKGYRIAENEPHLYHSVSPFNVATGKPLSSGKTTFSEVFGRTMLRLAEENPNIAAITAAMPSGTGLDQFAAAWPKRFFDVGIAEQHAVTQAAGMAASGIIPVFAVYSSFLQRAYDQVLHDVALQNLKVIFAIDRAGIVGEDGETHQGIYDIAFLRHIPNMTILAPCDYTSFEAMLTWAVHHAQGPVAIRYPRGSGEVCLMSSAVPVSFGKGVVLQEGSDLTLFASGTMVAVASETARLLEADGISARVVDARFIKPLDKAMLKASLEISPVMVTLEDHVVTAGFGSSVLEVVQQENLSGTVSVMGLPDVPVVHGERKKLMNYYKISPEHIRDEVIRLLAETQPVSGRKVRTIG